MKNINNATHVEGYLYDYELEEKVTGEQSKNPGTDYIRGSITIATDEQCLNTIKIYYTYVTKKTAKGNDNRSYSILKAIIDGVYPTVMNSSKEEAVKFRIDSALGLNEFYDSNGELVSVKRNEGGFIHLETVLNEDESRRNTFNVDMLITNAFRKEADEEKNIPEKVVVKGAIFDYKKALLPIEFVVTNKKAMDYFENLIEDHPIFTRVWGNQISQTVITRIETESAFGEPYVEEKTNTHKEFVITGANKYPYEWDSEETITAIELKEKMGEREIYLADRKKNQEEYNKKKEAPQVQTQTQSGLYNF